MKRVVRVADIGARRAWLWRNRFRFGCAGNNEQSRVLVDVSAIMRHDAQTGIQRVVRGVWSELSARNGDGFLAQPVYATNRQGYCYAPADFLESRPRRLKGEPVGLAPGDKFLGLDLSAHLLPKYRQQLRAWRKHGGSVHVVVYDLLPLERPEWFTEAASNHFRKWTELLASEVDDAICISDQVARQLGVKLNGTAGPRIGRLHMGADISASRPSTGLSNDVRAALERMRECPTILMVGTIEPRKGYEVALNAFEYLWQTNPADAANLVIVGKSGWMTSALQNRLLSHPDLGTRLSWLDRVSDEGLGLLYEAARGVLVTSRGEGFGLPLIEATTHRRHVLARDLPVFREQCLPNVLYFEDDSPPALARHLIDLLHASVRRPSAVDLPTWGDSVDRLLVEIGVGAGASRSPERVLCHAS
jgi:glycosyltransferase involved in cell wall biosynthesis